MTPLNSEIPLQRLNLIFDQISAPKIEQKWNAAGNKWSTRWFGKRSRETQFWKSNQCHLYDQCSMISFVVQYQNINFDLDLLYNKAVFCEGKEGILGLLLVKTFSGYGSVNGIVLSLIPTIHFHQSKFLAFFFRSAIQIFVTMLTLYLRLKLMFVYYIEIYVLLYIEIYVCILYRNICLHLQPCHGSSIPNLILVTGKSNLGRKGDF